MVFWWMYIARVTVDVPGPPRVMVTGMSKVCSEVMVRKIVATAIAGRNSGRVTLTKRPIYISERFRPKRRLWEPTILPWRA